MIDSWLLAVLCLTVLAICAVLRIILPGPSPDDRFVAMNTAITLGAASGLALCISLGNLVMLNIFIVVIALVYAGTMYLARSRDGEKA